jgi:salicylate hydroxylase
VDRPIHIVGGGIAGLGTALSLARHGLKSTVLEQAPQIEAVGAGIQLSPNAMKVLARLGLEDKLRQSAVEPRAIALMDGRTGRQLARLPLGETAHQRYGAPYLVIHRADLQAALLDACLGNALIDIQLGRHVSPAEDDGLTIAADGVRSAFRGALRQQASAQFTGHVAWRTTHDMAADVADEPVTRAFFGPGAHLVDYPIRSGTQRHLVAITATGQLPGPSASPQETLRRAFTGWHHDILARLLNQRDWTPWPLYGVDPAGPWVGTRLALVGDAAHAMLPFLAQGGAMAIEDGAVLAHHLACALPMEQAQRAYERDRKGRVSRVWKEARGNGRTYHMAGLLALARNTVLRTTPGQALLARYDWLYGWSPP